MLVYSKASSGDMAKLIGWHRRFDLLAVGLQEVPKHDVGVQLQAALAETHRYFILTASYLVELLIYRPSFSLLAAATMQSLQLFVFGPKNSQPLAKGESTQKQGAATRTPLAASADNSSTMQRRGWTSTQSEAVEGW